MSLASGHHRIMAAAQGALVIMVLGKVVFFSTHATELRQSALTSAIPGEKYMPAGVVCFTARFGLGQMLKKKGKRRRVNFRRGV